MSIRDRIIEIFNPVGIYTLATVDDTGRPRTRYMAGEMDENMIIWGSTFRGSRKVSHVLGNPEVSGLTVVDGEDWVKPFVEFEGHCDIITDPETLRARWREPFGQFFKGPDDPRYCIYRITPARFELHQGEYTEILEL